MTTNHEVTSGTFNKVCWRVFLVPWIILTVVVVLGLVDHDAFAAVLTGTSGAIVNTFSWFFALLGLTCLALLIAANFTRFGKVRIGGSKATPLLSRRSWMYVTLTTTIGAGILFFCTSEPIYHLYVPPISVAEGAGSPEAATMSMEIMFYEWTWMPYAIYALATVVFAFVFYNMRQKFSLSSVLAPVIGEKAACKVGPAVDCICLFTLVCGIASAMGAGTLNLSGGLQSVCGWQPSSLLKAGIMFAIVATFVAASYTGITRGIKKLAEINMQFYWFLLAFVLIAGPTVFIASFSTETYGAYLADYLRLSLNTGTVYGDDQFRSWPVFYVCAWLSWAPLSSMFLGRISRGYTVREVINTNLVFPALFCSVWIGIFSSSAICYEFLGVGLYDALVANGFESVIYLVLKQMPWSAVIIPIYIFVVFISFVTATDSNTTAMAGICYRSAEGEDAEPPKPLKVVWGVMIGVCSYVLITAAGLDGVKMIANIGGFPNAILQALMCVALIRIIKDPARYDVHKEDYDESGNPLPSVRLPVEGYQPDWVERLINKTVDQVRSAGGRGIEKPRA